MNRKKYVGVHVMFFFKKSWTSFLARIELLTCCEGML